jgi:toxin FitB
VLLKPRRKSFSETIQVWGKLRLPHYENAIDKQMATSALDCGLTLVIGNVKDFVNGVAVQLLNPFE